ANPGRSQAAIGQALHIERARLARMLHELERRSWVERRDGDGRTHSLFLTDGGVAALAKIKALAARHEQQLAEMVGPKRRKLLVDLLGEFGGTSVGVSTAFGYVGTAAAKGEQP